MKYYIDEKIKGMEIKSFLNRMKFSNSLVRKLKKDVNGILVNGKHQNVLYVLKENDVLELNFSDSFDEVNKHLKPIAIPIDVIYEDDNITVVNKPPNMPTHESINNRENSLANALAYRYRDKPYVFRASNRLDKDTSGLVITANNKFYSALLSEKIKNHEVIKEYIAVVEGRLEGDGVINAPIDRVGESIIKREVRLDGDSAITEYQSLVATDVCSVILVKPKTGRTHQIRVHMAHLGHPLLGDSLYGGNTLYISRQALHCLKMNIKDVAEFYAPLTEDIVNLIRRYFSDDSFIPKN